VRVINFRIIIIIIHTTKSKANRNPNTVLNPTKPLLLTVYGVADPGWGNTVSFILN